MAVADQLPVMVAVSAVGSYAYHFVNQAFAAAFGQEKEAILEKGSEHTIKPLIQPKNWEVIRQYLPGFRYYDYQNGGGLNTIYFVKYAVGGGGGGGDHAWLLCQKQFLSPQNYFGLYLPFKDLGSVGDILKEHVGDLFMNPAMYRRYHTLTFREKQVLPLICRGLTNQKIAALLSLSRNTVRTHRNHIWKKLAIGDCRDALAYRVLTEAHSNDKRIGS